MLNHLETVLQHLRETKPIVLSVTNDVTMDFIANSLLAVGASPIMTVGDEELNELISISGSLNLNIGTLNKAFIKRCHLAASIAQKSCKPVILDPVGAGASELRTQTARALMPYASIIKGNASEIMALVDHTSKTLGVDATNTTNEAKKAALELAKTYQSTIVVTGPVDFITDGNQEIQSPYGSDLMALVTGMGCTLTAIIAAFHATLNNPFEASYLATQYVGLCGQLAAKQAQHPASFRVAFIDALHEANFTKLRLLYAQ